MAQFSASHTTLGVIILVNAENAGFISVMCEKIIFFLLIKQNLTSNLLKMAFLKIPEDFSASPQLQKRRLRALGTVNTKNCWKT